MNVSEPCTPAVSPEVVAAISAALAQKLQVRLNDVRITSIRRGPLPRQPRPEPLDLSEEELAVITTVLSAELGRNVGDLRITSIRAL